MKQLRTLLATSVSRRWKIRLARYPGPSGTTTANRDLQAQPACLSRLRRPRLADAYLQDGQKVLACQSAQEALALLDAHKVPRSSWNDTDERRSEIRQAIEDVLKKTAP